jgi:hypothetical protein
VVWPQCDRTVTITKPSFWMQVPANQRGSWGIEMRSLLQLALGTVILSIPLVAPSQAANLSQPAALQKATAILKGDPYGKTAAEVRKHIVGTALVYPNSRTESACGPMKKPVYVFNVAVPARSGQTSDEAISGELVLDAATGKLECATLPFLN